MSFRNHVIIPRNQGVPVPVEDEDAKTLKVGIPTHGEDVITNKCPNLRRLLEQNTYAKPYYHQVFDGGNNGNRGFVYLVSLRLE